MAKTTITLPDKDLAQIREYCSVYDVKVSQVFRKSVRKCLPEIFNPSEGQDE